MCRYYGRSSWRRGHVSTLRPKSQRYLNTCLKRLFSFYDDLYPLVKFLPGYNMPSGIPPPEHAYNDKNHSVEQLQSRSSSPFLRDRRERVADAPRSKTPSPASTLNKLAYENKSTKSAIGLAQMHSVLTANVVSSSPQTLFYDRPFSQPRLRPARCPPKHHWSEAMPIRYLPFAKSKRRERRMKQAMYASSSSMGQTGLDSIDGRPLAQNVPLEITMYMVSMGSPPDRISFLNSRFAISQSCYIAAVQRRKTCEAVNASEYNAFRPGPLLIMTNTKVLFSLASKPLQMPSLHSKGFC